MTRTPDSSYAPAILYRAALAPGIRVLIVVLLVLASLVPTAMLILILVAALDAPDPFWMLVGTASIVMILLLLVGFVFVTIRGAWSAFIVSTAGITIRGIARTVHIPWAEVAVIQLEQNLMYRGQAVVVTRSGSRIGSPVTSARFAMRRGESTYDHGPQLLHPAVPVRTAIDAHQRYLRGEFRSPATPA